MPDAAQLGPGPDFDPIGLIEDGVRIRIGLDREGSFVVEIGVGKDDEVVEVPYWIPTYHEIEVAFGSHRDMLSDKDEVLNGCAGA